MHTGKRDKKEIAVRGAKADKLGFTLQYTCIDKNEARFKRGLSYVLIFTLMGTHLVFSLEKPTWKVKNRNLF